MQMELCSILFVVGTKKVSTKLVIQKWASDPTLTTFGYTRT